MSRGKHFSQEELEFLKVNSLVMTTKELADKLGRNYWAVHRKLQAIGIIKNHIFTPDEDFVIKKNVWQIYCQGYRNKDRCRRKCHI